MTTPLEDVQDEILTKLHAGEDVDRGAVLAAHPEHADALREFFRVLDVIETAPAEGAALPASLGEFRIVREIGRGGMGVVYEAEQTSLKRRVALKVLPPALRMDPRLVVRFQREAEAAGKLRHPGIVPVYFVGEAAGAPFFAMERIEGRSLDAILADLREGRDAGVPPAGEARRAWAVELVAKVADALDYAHGRGILHRDVKPANILIDRCGAAVRRDVAERLSAPPKGGDEFEGHVLVEADGTPRLTDFGLALDAAAPGLTMAGEVFGSLHYMSPEQAVRRESPVDARTDVYSLAVTLYETLTLRLPYDGSTSAELLTALTTVKIVPPREVDPSIPPALEAVLLRALRRDPTERYASAAAFAADLRAALAGGAVTCDKNVTYRSRRPGVVLAAAVAFVAAATAFLVGRAAGWWGAGASDADRDALTYADMRSFADGTRAADGALRRAFKFGTYLRPVVSRRDLAKGYACSAQWGVRDVGRLSAPVAVVVRWEASVDRGPWSACGASFMGFGPGAEAPAPVACDGGAVSRCSIGTTPKLAEVLGAAATKNSVSLRHRATVHIAARPEEWNDATKPLSGGASFTWTGDERAFVVCDDYPADYPTRVEEPKYDAAMRAAVTPTDAQFWGASTSKEGKRVMTFTVNWHGGLGPLPAAFDMDLMSPGRGSKIGTTTWSRPAAPDPSDPGTFSSCETVTFDLPAEPGPDEARLLLDLDSGSLKRLRLVFRPSRAAALENPDFAQYWGGTLDVTIPVTPGRR